MGDRPGSNLGRPMTSSTRLGSAMGNRGVPGTASRLLASAMQNRPASRTGIGLQTPINVADRPVTQQGLSGMRTGTAKGPQRQYQDKSYFMGQLRSKMSELQAEINKMNREIDLAKDEQSTYLDYDKRVKELAAELTGVEVDLRSGDLVDPILVLFQNLKASWPTTTCWWTSSTPTQRGLRSSKKPLSSRLRMMSSPEKLTVFSPRNRY